jgi:hypothetical protein
MPCHADSGCATECSAVRSEALHCTALRCAALRCAAAAAALHCAALPLPLHCAAARCREAQPSAADGPQHWSTGSCAATHSVASSNGRGPVQQKQTNKQTQSMATQSVWTETGGMCAAAYARSCAINAPRLYHESIATHSTAVGTAEPCRARARTAVHRYTVRAQCLCDDLGRFDGKESASSTALRLSSRLSCCSAVPPPNRNTCSCSSVRSSCSQSSPRIEPGAPPE